MAVGHKILIAAYAILSAGVEYRDLGAAYLDKRTTAQTRNTLVRRLESLGYRVILEPREAPAM
jgi:hypothetical protein